MTFAETDGFFDGELVKRVQRLFETREIEVVGLYARFKLEEY
jgi:hypothetical protein